MLKYKIDLNLFAIDVPKTVKEFNEDNEKLWRCPNGESAELFQAVYLKGIEGSVSEIAARMKKEYFHFMAQGELRNAEALESIDVTLKDIAESLRLIAGRV